MLNVYILLIKISNCYFGCFRIQTHLIFPQSSHNKDKKKLLVVQKVHEVI